MALTALIGSSPIPSHPDTSIIEATVESIRSRMDCKLIVMADGVRPEQEHLRDGYELYLERLYKLCRFEWDALYFHPVTWLHQATLTRKALLRLGRHFGSVFLFAEHDTPLSGEIPFDHLADIIQDGVVDLIRFYHEAEMQEEHLKLVTGVYRTATNTTLLLTRQWSQRPHLVSTRFYIRMLEKFFPLTSRTYIEDRVHGPAQNEPWRDWKLSIYDPNGDMTGMQRSIHLDGRAGEPKFDLRFE